MQKNKLLVVALGALFALPALAEEAAVTQHKEGVHVIPASAHTVTSNVSLVSDYIYRGISQTGAGPAIQGGFDYAHAIGIYAGIWGSSISTLGDGELATSAGTELDTYFGYKGAAGGVSYDVGFLRYNYPGDYGTDTKADTNEVYGAVSYSIVTAKYSYSLGDTFGIADAGGTSYVALSASYPIADTGITLGAHYGKQTFKGAPADALAAAGTTATYSDYKLSASKDFSGYVLGLAYSGTDDASAWYTGITPQAKELGKGTAVLSLARSF